MGDEDKLDIDWDKLTDISIDYDTLIGTDYRSDTNYDDWLKEYVGNISLADIDIGPYHTSPLNANNISLSGGGEEMLRVAPDGFYIRGVKVEADEKEAKAVYEAFKQWMTWAIMNGEINN